MSAGSEELMHREWTPELLTWRGCDFWTVAEFSSFVPGLAFLGHAAMVWLSGMESL